MLLLTLSGLKITSQGYDNLWVGRTPQ